MESEYPILITLGSLLIITPIVKSILEHRGIPTLVGYIGLGFLISLFNHVSPFINDSFTNTFSVLAQLGVVALLFRVGLNSHIQALLRKLPDASFIWLGDVLTNLVLGFAVSHYALSLSLETSLAIATAFSATSVAISVSVWEEVKKLNTSRGQLLVDVAELDDLSGVLLLAILLAIIPVLHNGDGSILSLTITTTVMVIFKLGLFITGCYLFAHYVEADFTRFSSQIEDSTTALAITILGAGLAIAAVAGYLGFSLAIGALFAGLAFSRDPETVRTKARFRIFHDFFSPFFFIYIGMQVDPTIVLGSIGIGIILFVTATIGKIIGVAGPALLSIQKRDALLLGISMVPRAEIALIIIYQCQQLDKNIISANIFSGMVLVVLTTSVFAPLILRPLLAQENKG